MPRFLLLGEILDGLHCKYQFPRVDTLGRRVNKGKKKGRSYPRKAKVTVTRRRVTPIWDTVEVR